MDAASIIRNVVRRLLSLKEVIQPHLPVRLPCYDFTPVMKPTVDAVLLAVGQTSSGEPHSHGVTGGVYKTRERIHRGMLIRDYYYDRFSGICSASRLRCPLFRPLYDV